MTIRKILDATKASLVLAIIASLLLPAQSGAVIQGQLISSAPLQTYSGSIRGALADYEIAYAPVADTHGNYFTLAVNGDNIQIVKLDAHGALLRQISLPAGHNLDFPGLTIDRNNNIYLSTYTEDGEDGTSHILRFNNNGDLTLTTPDLRTISNADDVAYRATISIAVDSQGNIYSTSGDFILKLSSTGAVISTARTPTDAGTPVYPYSLAISKDDTLFGLTVLSSDPDSRMFVAEYNASGQPIRKLDNGNLFPVGYGLAIDGNDNLYALSMTDFEAGDPACDNMEFAVRKYNRAGAYLGNLDISSEASEGPICTLYGVGASSASIGVAANGDVLLGSGNLTGETGHARIAKYSYQRNQATFIKNSHTSAASLTVSGDATILSATNNTPADINAPADGNKSFPLGLVRFSANVNHTNPVGIELLFATDLLPHQVSARKYNSVTRQYGDIPGATVTAAQLDGKPALKLTYSILDGGSLDEDGVVNGVIVDPVGLAVAETPLLAPNTGFEQTNSISLLHTLAIGLGVISLYLVLLLARQRYYR